MAVRVPVAPKSTKFGLDKLRVDGSSPPLTLMDLPDSWGGPLLWLPDGDILVHQLEPRAVIRVPSDGGRAGDPLIIENEGFEGLYATSPSQASVLPDRSQLLGNVVVSAESGWNIHVGLLDLATGKARIVIDNGANPKWSATGHVLFTRGATLLAVPFDPQRLETTGAQLTVNDGLRAASTYADAWFDVFPDGTLLHEPGGLVGADRRLMFLDESTMQIGEPWSEERRPFEGGLTVSRDGSQLAVGIVNAEAFYEIWTSETDRPRLTRLVRVTGKDCGPGPWHPDGERLTYSCWSTQGMELGLRASNGSGAPLKLVETSSPNETYAPNSFTPDGSALIVTHSLDNEPELMRLSLDEVEAAPVKLLEGARAATVSPDGQFIAYVSDSSGREEVYLRSIDSAGRVGREIPVTRDGCAGPFWRSAIGERPLRLGYGCSFQAYEVTVSTGDRVGFSKPGRVADWSEMWPKIKGGAWRLPDGRWLAVIQGYDEEAPRELSVVVNWRQELERTLRAAR
jgi:hypothetical protein